MINFLNKREAKEELDKKQLEAEELIKNKDEVEEKLVSLENKLKVVPKVGKRFAMVPIMISLVRSYIKKEYDKVPIGTILAILGALLYILTPIDAIPDYILGIGYVDDFAVLAACLKLVNHDLKKYSKWRDKNNK